MGRLEAIWTKRAHMGPMDARLTATAIPGKGLAGCVGNSRTRQVTLIEREVWDDLMKKTGGNEPPSARRANLMVSGIPLAHSRNRLLRVGAVLLRIGGETTPCEKMEDMVSGLQEAMHQNWGGGAFAQVIEGGDIAVGDPVEWVEDEARPQRPKAILLDLDDTILNDTGSVEACWEEACRTGAKQCAIDVDVLLKAIQKSSRWFWSDPERHRVGRLDLKAARVEVARLGLAELGIENREWAEKIGGIYHDGREERIDIFPEAVGTLRWFRERACKLALLTNGNGAAQRKKIQRFDLEPFFDAILIEGEIGFGKPDERIYRLALETLAVDARDAWMVGDNLEFDVVQPQRLGIFAVWIDGSGNGNSRLGSVRPDRIIRTLSELIPSF